MPRDFQFADDDLVLRLAEALQRAVENLDRAEDARAVFSGMSIGWIDRASRLMEERCTEEHRQAMASMDEEQ